MRAFTGARVFIGLCAAAAPSSAVTRRSVDHPFYARTAVTGTFGAGVAVGEFASDKDGDGNQESPAFDWCAEIEHYVAPGLSVGLFITHTSYDDKDLGGDLKTNLSTFGGFLRYVVDTGGPAYPFLRLGFGSMEVEFEDPTTRDESEHSGTVHLGGGGIFMAGDYVSLNASAAYNFGFTDDAVVGDIIIVDDVETVQIVGFDVQYWTFAAGVSLYFP